MHLWTEPPFRANLLLGEHPIRGVYSKYTVPTSIHKIINIAVCKKHTAVTGYSLRRFPFLTHHASPIWAQDNDSTHADVVDAQPARHR